LGHFKGDRKGRIGVVGKIGTAYDIADGHVFLLLMGRRYLQIAEINTALANPSGSWRIRT
jgi:hypothetical protein